MQGRIAVAADLALCSWVLQMSFYVRCYVTVVVTDDANSRGESRYCDPCSQSSEAPPVFVERVYDNVACTSIKIMVPSEAERLG